MSRNPYAFLNGYSTAAGYNGQGSVRVVIGEPWSMGAKAELEFPYKPGPCFTTTTTITI